MLTRRGALLFAVVLVLALGGLAPAPAAAVGDEPAQGDGADALASPEPGLSGAWLPPDPNPLANGAALASASKWIDVNLTRQTISAYLGSTRVRSVLVSTGAWRTPTVVGRFRIYAKVHAQTMTGGSRALGDYYYLPGVPHVMYFYRGYAIHGTYWHRNFGHPMSHGCVNLTLPDASWFYGWAPAGTLVVSHF